MKRSLMLICSMFLFSQLNAADSSATRGKIEEALGGSIREAAEIARDANRKPGEVLEFFGLEDDMKVLEISPATGYWSKFVGPTLCNNGGELVFSVSVSDDFKNCLLYTSPSPRDATLSRMPSSA